MDSTKVNEYTYRYEKLKGFENWPEWADLTCTSLEEKGVWDLVDGTRPLLAENAAGVTIRTRDKEIAIACNIIKQGVGSELYANVIGERNPVNLWNTLERISSRVGQGVVYSLLKEVLNYPQTNRPLGFEKKSTAIFGEVKQLVDRLQAAVTPNRTIWDSIVIVVALDSLHEEFQPIIAPLLHAGDKELEEIQQIVTSTEAGLMAKRATGISAGDVAMSSRFKFDPKPRQNRNNDECFYCNKKGHYARDCNKRKNEEGDINSQEAKRARWQKTRDDRKAASIRERPDNNNDLELFAPGRACMTKEFSAPRESWYLDSCASKHMTNNKDAFESLIPWVSEFTTAGGEIIRSKGIGTVTISLPNRTSIKLQNIAYIPECNSNLISLGQLRDAGIRFHNHLNKITLI